MEPARPCGPWVPGSENRLTAVKRTSLCDLWELTDKVLGKDGKENICHTKKFIEEVLDSLGEQGGETLELSVCSEEKNNGRERKGIAFYEKGVNASTTIYLEEYYEKFLMGSDVEELARQALEAYRKIQAEQPWNGISVRNFEDVEDKIIYRLVNKERNRGLLG